MKVETWRVWPMPALFLFEFMRGRRRRSKRQCSDVCQMDGKNTLNVPRELLGVQVPENGTSICAPRPVWKEERGKKGNRPRPRRTRAFAWTFSWALRGQSRAKEPKTEQNMSFQVRKKHISKTGILMNKVATMKDTVMGLQKKVFLLPCLTYSMQSKSSNKSGGNQ